MPPQPISCLVHSDDYGLCSKTPVSRSDCNPHLQIRPSFGNRESLRSRLSSISSRSVAPEKPSWAVRYSRAFKMDLRIDTFYGSLNHSDPIDLMSGEQWRIHLRCLFSMSAFPIIRNRSNTFANALSKNSIKSFGGLPSLGGSISRCS